MGEPTAVPGWYPDPSGAPGQRYFDGRTWTDHRAAAPPPPGQPEPPKQNWKVIAGIVAGLLVLVLIISAVQGTGDNDETAATSTSSTTARSSSSIPPAVAAPAPSTAAPTIPCQPAPDNLVAIINASFTDSSEQLVRAVSVEAPKDMIYIAGDIEAGGQRVSSADVWLFQHGAMLSLSGDARRRTIFADGRDFASAGDEYGIAAQNCITR